MAHSRPGYQIYQQHMSVLGFGLAIWNPLPQSSLYDKLKIGDVGYVREGEFFVLFSAASPLGARRLGQDVPSDFGQLSVGELMRREPRPPAALRSGLRWKDGGDLGFEHPLTFQVEDDALLGGGVLVTRYETYGYDTRRSDGFKRYVLGNYKSWTKFANSKGHNVKAEDLILVSGLDTTEDFAMAAFDYNKYGELAFTPGTIPSLPSQWGSWQSNFPIHSNCSPPFTQNPSPGTRPGAPPKAERRQCVFVRGYRIRLKMGIFPKVVSLDGVKDEWVGEAVSVASPTSAMVHSSAESPTDISVRRPSPQHTASHSHSPDHSPRPLPPRPSPPILTDVHRATGSSSQDRFLQLIPVTMLPPEAYPPSLIGPSRPSNSGNSSISDYTGGSNGAIVGFPRLTLDDPASEKNLSKDDAQVAIDAVWALLDLHPHLSQASVRKPPNHRLRELAVKIALTYNVLPSSFLLLNTVLVDGEHRWMGGFSDIFYGEVDGMGVAIKRLRSFSSLPETKRAQFKKVFYRECLLWKGLAHQHILSFLGVAENIFPGNVSIVTPWMQNGRIGDYIQRLYEDGQLDGPAFPAAVNEWLRQIALGVQYLHSEHIVHGDLHGGNILVDSDGTIRLTDFGMSVTSDGTPYRYGSIHGGGAAADVPK
ncbi:hypothetical protein EIP91_001239 [Steccherinum ochraceum]|uniref:Protein kinase domain-containing protein n=1 Tax=Steccherinum ochraceum TaxID=92696 RepID=A0A4R0REK5_9APHY|nr:hypothetical protein EIP91_001239 [Steccherinum ochraceum]